LKKAAIRVAEYHRRPRTGSLY